jgi:ATP-binding cassette subfamily B protein
MLSKNIWYFIWHFLKPYKKIIIVYIFLATLAGCWGPFNSMLIKYMINIVSDSHAIDTALLSMPAILIVLNFVIFDNVTWRLIGYLNYKYQPVIKNNIISDTFSFVLASQYQFFQDNLSGRIAGQINTLADNIERILHRISADFIRGFSLLLVALLSLYIVNASFFTVLALWFIAFFLSSLFMSKRLVNLSNSHTDAESLISGELVDSMSNVSNVRIFARRSYEIARLEKSLQKSKVKFQKKELFLIKLNSIQGSLIALMLGSMVYFLIESHSARLISIGDFALVLGLSMEVAYISWYTMSQVNEFYQALGKCKQSLACLIIEQDIKDKQNAPNLVLTRGEITFENVHFNYQNTEPLFQNKSLVIKAGQKVGLVGYSGGGKSTFVNLILRLYDVVEGRILIDGQDIRELNQDSLRMAIGMIPQDPVLFHRTLMENIRYGNINASDEDVINAAKKAHAHDFIKSLRDGYDSPVGERGVKLSGGQRQRIAIARAILKNAPILILDEATSQLDSVTEREIQSSLWQLMKGKTTIVIAHRLSTLLRMDRIIVFDQGKIVEDGSHSDLLAEEDSLYRKLWYAQVGGFLADYTNI